MQYLCCPDRSVLLFCLEYGPCRKEKLEVLGPRFVKVEDKTGASHADADDEAALGELETVFSCGMLPLEFYSDLLHMASASALIDVSPAQGQVFFF